MRQLLVFHTTYPSGPNYAKDTKLGTFPYEPPGRFEKKEEAFLRAAEHFGLDTSEATFHPKISTHKRLRQDLSYLLIPGKDGSDEHYYVAFYSL